MTNIEFLNSILQLIVVLFVICLAINIIIMRKIPFIKINNDYVSIIDLIYYVLKFLSSTLFSIILTVFTYYSFGTSSIIISEIKNEAPYLFLLILGAIIVSSWINVITKGVNFVYKLILYIQLRRNTISNNLRHALANKDEHAIIENFKLLKQTDDIIKISSHEIFILTACLSKYGYNEDVKEILKPNLYKKRSLLYKFNTLTTVIVEYNIKSSDKFFTPSNTIKHKLKYFENITIITSFIMSIIYILQFVIVTFAEIFNIPNTIIIAFVCLTNIFAIGLILMKHSRIKKIYRKELEITKLANDHIKIRKPIIDNALLGLSAFMIVNALVQVLS